MKTETGVLALGLLCSAGAHAGLSVGAGTEYMEWREYDAFNEKLLTESGVRVFATAEFSHAVEKNIGLVYSAKLYTGDVDYDGQYQDGTPVTSETGYAGVNVEVRGLFSSPPRSPGFPRRAARSAPLAVAIGLGVDSWTRDIKGAGGYEEEYLLPYLRLGLEQTLDERAGAWSSRGGVLFPFNVQEKVNLLDGIDLEPEGKPSLYFDVGYRLTPEWELEFGYQGYRLGESDISSEPVTQNGVPVDINGDGFAPDYVLQPESDLDTFSFALRYQF